MKKLLICLSLILMISIYMLSGCSDNPVSSESVTNKEIITGVSGRSFEDGTFSKKYLLRNGETVNLSMDITGLILINSYTISNCTINTREIYIRTSNQVGNSSLPCMWKKSGNFAFEDLSIKNISGQTRTIEVWIEGLTLGKSGNGMQGGDTAE
ncbi:MAG: hypothetical protein WAT71_13870 [Ignavibacteria bacterium]